MYCKKSAQSNVKKSPTVKLLPNSLSKRYIDLLLPERINIPTNTNKAPNKAPLKDVFF